MRLTWKYYVDLREFQSKRSGARMTPSEPVETVQGELWSAPLRPTYYSATPGASAMMSA